MYEQTEMQSKGALHTAPRRIVLASFGAATAITITQQFVREGAPARRSRVWPLTNSTSDAVANCDIITPVFSGALHNEMEIYA